MSYLQIFKRIIPFFLTFAAGLLIASIFVPITGPSFRKADRSGKWRHHKELKWENQNLRRENDRLKQELEATRLELEEARTEKFTFGETPLELRVPPPPPHVIVR